VLDTHAPPSRRKVIRHRNSPWYPSVASELHALKQEKRRAERRWLATRLTVDKQILHIVKHKETELVSQAKIAFYSSEISSAHTCKELFKLTGNLMGKASESPLPSNVSPSHLPQVFSDFFSGKVLAIREALDASVSSPSQFTFQDPIFSGTPLASFEPLSEDAVRKVMMSMSPKTCDLDCIPTKLLLECADVVVPSLTQFVNDILIGGTFPQSLKRALVRPLLKKPSLDPNDLKNFRPVSNLSFFSKLVERIVLSQLLAHLDNNNLWPAFQSAYRSHHSTETALLRVFNDLLQASDSDKVSILTLLDLSAAFDTVDHKILLHHLENTFGIHGTALAFFRTYLEDRDHR